MKIKTWKHMLREGFINIFRNRILSLASVCAITAALFVLGLVMVLVYNLDSFMTDIESTMEVTVFLTDGTNTAVIERMEGQMAAWEGVYEVEFVSKAQALEDFRQEWGDKQYLLDGFGEDNNPLPDSIRIHVERPEYVEAVVQRASVMSRVYRVQYSRDVVNTIERIAAAARMIGLTVVVVLLIMAMIIVGNTIKMTIYSRRLEINIMKYIGATDWFVRWPFLIEGLALGLLGAAAAAGFTSLVYRLLLGNMGQGPIPDSFLAMFRLLPMRTILPSIWSVLLGAGSITGLLAGYLSLRKHLRV